MAKFSLGRERHLEAKVIWLFRYYSHLKKVVDANLTHGTVSLQSAAGYTKSVFNYGLKLFPKIDKRRLFLKGSGK